MLLNLRSGRAGTSVAVGAVMLAAVIFSRLATAETVFTVNGTPVDSAVIDAFFAQRLGNANAQPTPDQRTILIAQLRDIYVLATQDIAKELASDPQLAAQLELQRQGALAQAVAADFISKVEVSDAEIRAEYEEQIRRSPPLQFKARHILVPTQGEAVDLISQLDGGADFQELAKEKSTGPSGPEGGDLGWFSPEQMVPPFSAAVSTLTDGSYTKQPVQTQFGWHVILREESRENTPPTLESVRDRVIQQVQQKKFQEHLATLREAATE
ncbi:MAG: peptidylprolyl isomerase [Woeseiaceae bacterium]|nr:peptidylprolyl isomerase [Woeseiaceae bacterium]